MVAPSHIIKLGHARDQLRQHFAIDAGLESMDHRPLGSDPKQVDAETRELCREQMQNCRDNAHWEIAGMIGGSKITVWKERPDGGLESSGPRWAQDQFDAPGLASDRLYFDRNEWDALLPTMASAKSRAYIRSGIELGRSDLTEGLDEPGPKFGARINPSKKLTGKGDEVESRPTGGEERQWLRISKAVRILHRILKTRLAGQEPAPWIDPPADPFDADRANATHRHRRTARTSLTLRRALMSGDLTTHLVNDGRSHPLPGWAWENANAAENAFHFNWIPLNPLLDHGLQEYGDWRCFVSRAEFKAWVSSPRVAMLGDLPTLPVPFDRASQPNELSYREPPGKPFIELTQAVTWIAFAISLSRDEFSFTESCRFGPFAQSGWPDALRAAMAGFADQASAGNIRVRGRYVANYSDHTAAAQANTDYLSDTQMRDFASFDSHYGGLERGAGLVWEGDILERALNGRGDGWRDVEVCRADLMKAFPAKGHEAGSFFAPIPASLPDVGLVMTLDEALSRLAVGRSSADLQVWQNGAGKLTFRDHNGDELRRKPDGSHAQFLELFLLASRAMHSALRDGSLLTYVAPAVGPPLQVPRFYWNSVSPDSLHHVYRGMTPDDQGAGCSVLFSRRSFDAWKTTIPATGTEQPETPLPKARRKRPGPPPDPDWPNAITEVTQDCIAAGYRRSRKRGDKAAIQTMLLNFMAAKDKHFSEDTAAKHAETVIAALPDN